MASQDLLLVLENTPQKVFDVVREEEGNSISTYFSTLVKQLLDPVSKEYSVLDEIYTDGLDALQVFGQTKLVLEGVSEKLLFDRIPELKDKAGDGDEDEEENEDQFGEEEEEEEEDVDEEEVGAFAESSDELHNAESESEEEEQDEDEISDSETLHENRLEAEVENASDEGSDTETVVAAPKKDAFGLNDKFFDIDEFNKQMLALEDNGSKNNEQDEEEEIDYFEDLSDSDEEEDMPYFDDFYKKPTQQGTKKSRKEAEDEQDDEEEEDDEEEDDDEEDEDAFKFDDDEYDRAVGGAMKDLFDEEDEQPAKNEANMSRFEKEQQKLRAEIEKLEAELVAEKKWTMKGEVNSGQRPQDSLLDDPDTATLDFDRVAKPVPIITDEVTETIEGLIKRRIKEEDFNDLPKRFITDVATFHNKKKYELSEEKSKKSLAEIYEDQYANVDPNKEVNEELQKRHDEISQLFATVSHKLDALCSAHFVPAPHQFKSIDIKVTDNDSAAAISMEDAQPIHVASEAALAPQEIYKIGDDKVAANGVKGRSEVQLKSGLSYSKDELSKEDKQRLRRANKRKRAKEFERRENHTAQVAQADKNSGKTERNTHKKAKVGEVIDTLSKAKNVSVIGKKGELRDVKGNIKKNKGPQTSNGFML